MQYDVLNIYRSHPLKCAKMRTFWRWPIFGKQNTFLSNSKILCSNYFYIIICFILRRPWQYFTISSDDVIILTPQYYNNNNNILCIYWPYGSRKPVLTKSRRQNGLLETCRLVYRLSRTRVFSNNNIPAMLLRFISERRSFRRPAALV